MAHLPIDSMRMSILKAVLDNPVVIIDGKTGSGKSTKLVQFLSEGDRYASYGRENMKIVCTQPRRSAAVQLAKFVAGSVSYGQDVGSHVRFENRAWQKRIVYMTEGILLQILFHDRLLSQFEVVIIDEAHERNVNTDLLLGALKHILSKRNDLKVIVMSATFDSGRFATYMAMENMPPPPVITIEGSCFPVEELMFKDNISVVNYIDAAIKCVHKVMDSKIFQAKGGHFLIFLAGQDDVDYCSSRLQQENSDLFVVRAYRSLPEEEFKKVFAEPPNGKTKVVVSTNITETSLTIDGIVYIIDSGVEKVVEFDPSTGSNSLLQTHISRSSAEQRRGRAGRTRPGHCFRLYDQNYYHDCMDGCSIAEIQRVDPTSFLLSILCMGFSWSSFPFLDAPHEESIEFGRSCLFHLGAIDKYDRVTTLGRQISRLPVEPWLAKALLCSSNHGCSQEILSIAAMLSIDWNCVLLKPLNKREQYTREHAIISHNKLDDGDVFQLLAIFEDWHKHSVYKYDGVQKINYDKSNNYCFKRFVRKTTLHEAFHVRQQLENALVHEIGDVSSTVWFPENTVDKPRQIKSALFEGFFIKVTRRMFDESLNYEFLPMFLFDRKIKYQLGRSLEEFGRQEFLVCGTVEAFDEKLKIKNVLFELDPDLLKTVTPKTLNTDNVLYSVVRDEENVLLE